mgnify:CR=1 FL=1|eukprot:scaffold105572_cov26-Tisochrysis_lutea.AAC.2
MWGRAGTQFSVFLCPHDRRPSQVQRGFYNGLPVTIAVDEMPKSLVDSGGVVASGQPSMLGGDITGFVDPRTGDYRQVPLERWLEVKAARCRAAG